MESQFGGTRIHALRNPGLGDKPAVTDSGSRFVGASKLRRPPSAAPDNDSIFESLNFQVALGDPGKDESQMVVVGGRGSFHERLEHSGSRPGK